MDQILRASGLVVGTAPERGEVYQLDELRAIVGGYIEMVRLADGRVMVVNAEGKLKGLPANEAATRLFWHGRATQECIVGDVLVTTRRGAGYNEAPDDPVEAEPPALSGRGWFMERE